MPTLAAGRVVSILWPTDGQITITPGSAGRVSLNARGRDGSQSIAPREIYNAETINVSAGDTVILEAINTDATYTSPVSGNGNPQDALTLLAQKPGNADYRIQSHQSEYYGEINEVWSAGYNLGNQVTTHPAMSIRLETNYFASHKGQIVKTTESYFQFTGPISGETGGVTACQIRPWFYAWGPQDQTFGRSGEMLYGYMLTGRYRTATQGGGGLTIGSGDDNTADAILSFDTDGAFAQKALMAQSPEPIGIASATAGANCQITFAVAHPYQPGSAITIFAKSGGMWTPGATVTVTAVSGLTVTTDGNNTAEAILPAAPTAGTRGARLPHNVAMQVITQRLGVNTAILGGDTDVAAFAGPTTFYGKTYYVKPGSAKNLFGAARMGFSYPGTDFQAFSFANGSQGYSFGHLSGNSATFGFGAGQSTDSNFTSGNSIITFDAAQQSVGIGGTIANNGAYLRVRGGSASRATMFLNNQTDAADPPTIAGGVTLYAKAGKLYAKDAAGVVTQLTP